MNRFFLFPLPCSSKYCQTTEILKIKSFSNSRCQLTCSTIQCVTLYIYCPWLGEFIDIFILGVTVLGCSTMEYILYTMDYRNINSYFSVLFKLNNQVETHNLVMNCLFIINKENKSVFAI